MALNFNIPLSNHTMLTRAEPQGHLTGATLHEQLGELQRLPTSGFKNKLINGNFDVWYRGNSQTSNGYSSDDRWLNEHNGSSKIHSRQEYFNSPVGLPTSIRRYSRTVVTSVTGANSYAMKRQRIEGVQTLAGTTSTLSFWAKSNAPKFLGVSLSQSFGTGGTSSNSVLSIGAQKIALNTSWSFYDIQIAVPSIIGKDIGTDLNSYLVLEFWFDAGTNFDNRSGALGHQSGTFDIAQVQLEEGPIATPFEQRHIAQERALCKRYYEVLTGSIMGPYTASGTTSGLTWQFEVEKRTTPAQTLVGCTGTFNNISTKTLTLTHTNGIPVIGNGTSVDAEL